MSAEMTSGNPSATFRLTQPQPEQITRAETLLFHDIAPSVRAMGRAVEAAQSAATHVGRCYDEAKTVGAVTSDQPNHWSEDEFGKAFSVAAQALDAVAQAHRDLAEIGLRFVRQYEQDALRTDGQAG